MLFEDAEQTVELALGGRARSTPETQKRYAFLKTKRVGSYCYDGARYLYRNGPQGVTVFDTWVWFGQPLPKRGRA